MIVITLYALLLPFSSTFTMHTAPWLLLFFWIMENRFEEKMHIIFNSKPILFLLLFFLINILSLLWSDNISHGLKMLKTYFAFLMPFLIIVTSLKKQHISFFIVSFLFAMFISEISSFGVFFEWWNINNTSSHDPSPFINHIHFGIFLVVTSVILLKYIIDPLQSKNLKLFLSVFLLFTVVVLFINAGRTGQIVFIAGIFVFLISQYGFDWKKISISIISLVILFTFAYSMSPVFNKRVNAIVASVPQIQNGNYNVELGYRLALKIASVPVIGDHIITGTGIGDEMDVFHSESTRLKSITTIFPHLHDQYLQILLQTGLLGFIPFLMFIISLFREKYFDHTYRSVLFGTLGIFLLASVADLTLRTTLAALFSFTFALFYTAAKMEPVKEDIIDQKKI